MPWGWTFLLSLLVHEFSLKIFVHGITQDPNVYLFHLRNQVSLAGIWKYDFILSFQELSFILSVPGHLRVSLTEHRNNTPAYLVLNSYWLILVYKVLHSAEMNLVWFSCMLKVSDFLPNFIIWLVVSSDLKLIIVKLLSFIDKIFYLLLTGHLQSL